MTKNKTKTFLASFEPVTFTTNVHSTKMYLDPDETDTARTNLSFGFYPLAYAIGLSKKEFDILDSLDIDGVD